jgi:hypothetical protein
MKTPRPAVWGLLIALVACRGRADLPVVGDPAARPDSARALVVQEAAVVAFWLPASDTLAPGEGAVLLDDFRDFTRLVGPFLDDRGIPLLATNAESLLVERGDGPRRVIMLTGLDFPFGYVLVEPGYAESILTGVSTEEELLDEVDWYFGLEGEGRPEARRPMVVLHPD